MRVGLGFDAHRFAPDRRLMLGGVAVPHEFGLAGHSDADVLIHAVIDALLGAAGLGDIGSLFPDSDPKYHDISSLELLRRAWPRVAARGFRIANLDSTVVCEAPRVGPHAAAMSRAMAAALGIEPGLISVKGKTTEGMGFPGRGEGIAAYAVALLVEAEPPDPRPVAPA